MQNTTEPPQAARSNRSEFLKAALSYAARGWPVFPLKPGGKEPVIPKREGGQGYLDATTDPSRITAWWNRWPDANIGIRTGEQSGILTLDVDHPASLEALEADQGKLPETRTHATGSGGMHYLFSYPQTGERFGNSSGTLPHGLDVRGEGGYIVAPPSRTTRLYEVLDPPPLSDPPEWFLQAIREPQRSSVEEVVGRPTTRGPELSATLDGPPIPQGQRNKTLTRIAGTLHDGSRTLGELTSDLLGVNTARCTPPLPEVEVTKIATSIHRKAPSKRKAPEVSPEVFETLQGIEADCEQREWRGMGGKSERSVYVALIKAARRCGVMIPTGVRVSISVRELALAAAVNKRSLLDYWEKGERKPGIITRLKKKGVIRSDSYGRSGIKAGAFVLVAPTLQTFTTHPSTALLRKGECGSGESLRSPRKAPYTAPRLRWSAPRCDRIGDEYVRSTIQRLGKTCEQAIDVLEATGGSFERYHDLAAAVNIKRPYDFRRRHLAKLEKAEVVECSGDKVSLTRDWLEALNRERKITGEIRAEWRDRERYEREREAYRNRRKVKVESVPQVVGGEIRELSYAPKPDPVLIAILREYLRRRPERIGEPVSWFRVALWADLNLSEKPDAGALAVALEEVRSALDFVTS